MSRPVVHTSLLDEAMVRVDLVVTLPSGVLAQTVQSIHCRTEAPARTIYHGWDAELNILLDMVRSAVLDKFNEERERVSREGERRIPSREEVRQ